MTPYALAVTTLAERGSRRQGNNWQCPVPSHGKRRGDQNPSLTVSQGDDGRVLLYCHAGCSRMEEVVPALGLDPAQLFPGQSILSLYPKEKRAPALLSGLLAMPASSTRDFYLATCFGRYLASDGSHRTVSSVQDMAAVVWDKPRHRQEFLEETGIEPLVLKKRIRQWAGDGRAHRCRRRIVVTFILRPGATRCPRCWAPLAKVPIQTPSEAGRDQSGSLRESEGTDSDPLASTLSDQPASGSLEVIRERAWHGKTKM